MSALLITSGSEKEIHLNERLTSSHPAQLCVCLCVCVGLTRRRPFLNWRASRFSCFKLKLFLRSSGYLILNQKKQNKLVCVFFFSRCKFTRKTTTTWTGGTRGQKRTRDAPCFNRSTRLISLPFISSLVIKSGPFEKNSDTVRFSLFFVVVYG